MRGKALVSLFAATLFLAVLLIPGPHGPTRSAIADHSGEIVCPPAPEPVHDGIVEPGEYVENFFDSKTKLLVYFKCSNDANRTIHLAMESPWDGWTEIRFQSAEVWDGDMNAVRASLSGSTAVVVDGFVDADDPQFVDDLSLGGSHDVFQPAARGAEGRTIYEFSLPLFSQDSYDCQLTSPGSIVFQLAFVPIGDGDPPVESISDPHVIHISAEPVTGDWTSVELSLGVANPPVEPTEILIRLRGPRGDPIPSMPLHAFARTAFGFLELGSAFTNEQGVASVSYTPREAGVYLIGAAFEGGGDFLASVVWQWLTVVSPAAKPSFVPRLLLMIGAIIVLGLGIVWGAYAYTVYLTMRSSRVEDESLGPRRFRPRPRRRDLGPDGS